MTISDQVQKLIDFLTKSNMFTRNIILNVIGTIFNAGITMDPGGKVNASIGGYDLTIEKEGDIIVLKIQKQKKEN